MKIIYILRKELYSIFVSPIAYVVMSIFMILSAYFFIMLLSYTRSADVIGFLLGNLTMILILICPILTMRLLSEEKNQGTEELLFTCPVRLWEVLLGKYVAACFFVVILLGLTLPFVWIVGWFGTPDWGPIITGYLGVVLLACAFNAVGIFASSLTRNQINSAILSFGFVLLSWIVGWAANITLGNWSGFFRSISILDHFTHFEQGVIHLTDLYYFLSFITLFLYWTYHVMQKFKSRILSTTATVSVGLMLCLFAVGYLIIQQYPVQWDLTQNKQFSLSEQTHTLLNRVQEPLHITAFFKLASFDGDMADTLLTQYTKTNPLITYQLVDPDRNPYLATQYGINAYGTTVFEMDKKRKDVEIQDVFIDEEFRGEQAFTLAIQSLLSTQNTTVYFLTGHREKDIDSTEQDGLNFLKDRLKKQNIQTQSLNLLRHKTIPNDADLLIIAGPQQKFAPHEYNVIKNYLNTHHSLMILLDPKKPVGLDNLFKEWGIDYQHYIVIDEASSYFMDQATVVPQYQPHIITDDLNNSKLPAMLPVAGALFPYLQPLNKKITPILSSSKHAWAETQIDQPILEFNPDTDLEGAFILGLLSEEKPTANNRSGKLMVFSDSDFISNGYLTIQGNWGLLINTITYLTTDPNDIVIQPKTKTTGELILSGPLTMVISVIVLFCFPLVIIITGLMVWFRRRRL